jgi:hypothetical protein
MYILLFEGRVLMEPKSELFSTPYTIHYSKLQASFWPLSVADGNSAVLSHHMILRVERCRSTRDTKAQLLSFSKAHLQLLKLIVRPTQASLDLGFHPCKQTPYLIPSQIATFCPITNTKQLSSDPLSLVIFVILIKELYFLSSSFMSA